LKNYKRGLLVALASILIVVFGAVSVYGAPNISTVVQAYKGVKIVYNGTTLTSEAEPFIINNTTYVPIRMLMNQFGKDISWDAQNQQVIIKNSADEINKDKQIEDLKNQVTALNAKIKGLETALGNADTTIRTIDEALNKYQKTSSTVTVPPNSDIKPNTTLGDLQTNLNKFFKDAGYEYFNDDGIAFYINLGGNPVDLVYEISLDFDNAYDYDRLNQVNQTKIKSLLNIVNAKIKSEAYGTDYQDAKITGKLIDQDNSSYYVRYNGSTYTFSWDESDDVISETTRYLKNYFKDKGDVYFSDRNIKFDISLSGDKNKLSYKIYINFDNSKNYDDLSEISKSYVRNYLNQVKSVISSQTSNTNFKNAEITGYLYYDYDSSYYVKYNGSSYTFSY